MLAPYSIEEPHYFGFRFKPYLPLGYMSGGAGEKYFISNWGIRTLNKISDSDFFKDTS